jgi:hypothetical protein
MPASHNGGVVNPPEIPLLHNEMRLSLNLCQGAKAGCPIIESMNEDAGPKKNRLARG